jgi:hypothetical protein
MPFRRRTNAQDDPLRRAFGVVASRVDHAQRILLSAVPTSRGQGIPLRDAIAGFLQGLDDAEAGMASWNEKGVAHEWTKCSDAIAEARTAAQRMMALDVELTFEQLNAQIGDVLYPLEAFIDAESRLRRR